MNNPSLSCGRSLDIAARGPVRAFPLGQYHHVLSKIDTPLRSIVLCYEYPHHKGINPTRFASSIPWRGLSLCLEKHITTLEDLRLLVSYEMPFSQDWTGVSEDATASLKRITAELGKSALENCAERVGKMLQIAWIIPEPVTER